jgi:hypothetical protein
VLIFTLHDHHSGVSLVLESDGTIQAAWENALFGNWGAYAAL